MFLVYITLLIQSFIPEDCGFDIVLMGLEIFDAFTPTILVALMKK